MADPFLCEIKIVSFNYPPKGWAFCNGQILPINQNQALFSLLGTTYGGDGRVNFALPDLRGRVAMHTGQGHTLGERAGEQAHTLTTAEMPAHTHQAIATSNITDQSDPTNNQWANGASFAVFRNQANTTMDPASVALAGGNQAHNNMSPFLGLNFCIALQGIFPSRD
jgi:microcystin-dependent protein